MPDENDGHRVVLNSTGHPPAIEPIENITDEEAQVLLQHWCDKLKLYTRYIHKGMDGEDKLHVAIATERIQQLLWHFRSKMSGIVDANIEGPQQRAPVSA